MPSLTGAIMPIRLTATLSNGRGGESGDELNDEVPGLGTYDGPELADSVVTFGTNDDTDDPELQLDSVQH